MFSLISQPTSALSQQDFNHRHFLHIHTQQASHILCMNLWEGTIKATLQLVKKHTKSVTLHMWESFEYLNQF